MNRDRGNYKECTESICPIIDNGSNNSNNSIIRGKNMGTGNGSNAFFNFTSSM